MAGLFDFLIVVVGLFVIGGIIWAALEFIPTDPNFKKIAQIAVAGVIIIAFIIAIRGVLMGGGNPLQPLNILWFAIGVIVVLLVWYVVIKIVEWAATVFPPFGRILEILKFIIAAIALISILAIAADELFSGGSHMASFTGIQQRQLH